MAPTASANQSSGIAMTVTTATTTGMELNASLLWCQALASRAWLLIRFPAFRV